MITTLIYKVRSVAQRSAFGAAGVACLLVGFGFLSSALWLAIAVVHSAILASLTLGLLYVGGGLIFIAFSKRRPAVTPPVSTPPSPPRTPTSQSDLIAAFLGGLDAGKAMRKRPKR